MNILAVIPARSGSKGVKNKNLFKIDGIPLVDYTIKSALKSKYIDNIILTSDSEKIIKRAINYDINYVIRPKYLSLDSSPTHPTILHAINFMKTKFKYAPDLIITLQPTSPFRKSKHIDESIRLYLKNKYADSLVSCIKVPHNFNPVSIMKLNEKKLLQPISKKKIYSRQQKPEYYARNGAAIYITSNKIIKENILGKNILPYLMDEFSSIDIDTYDDIKKAKSYLKSKLV